MKTSWKDKYEYFKSFFTHVNYLDYHSREIVVKRKLSLSGIKVTIALKNIEYYDDSGEDKHIWNYLDLLIYDGEPYVDGVLFELDNRTIEYQIKGYKREIV